MKKYFKKFCLYTNLIFFVSSVTLISSSCKKIKDDNLDELRKNNPNFNFVKEGSDYVLKSVDLSLKEKEEINLPNFITKISDNVFKDFRKLRRINLENIKEIGKEAFSNTGLKKLDLKSLINLGEFTFQNCKELEEFNASRLKTIRYKTFENCKNLRKINIPNTKIIEKYAFSNCYDLEFNDDVLNMKLHQLSFNNCKNYEDAYENKLNIQNNKLLGLKDRIKKLYVKRIYLPNDVYEIKDYAFFHNDFETIDLMNVKKIWSNAFAFCHSLTSIDLRNVTEISDGSFYECTSLKSINNLSKIKVISESAFAFNHQLKSIDLKGVKEIKQFAFATCSSLSEINLREVEKIGHNAFSECNSLETLDLKNVKKIETDSFKNCKKLKKIMINANINGENDNYKVINGKQVYEKSTNHLILNVN